MHVQEGQQVSVDRRRRQRDARDVIVRTEGDFLPGKGVVARGFFNRPDVDVVRARGFGYVRDRLG